MSAAPETLQGQIALVTGGGRGLGRIMAQHLATAGVAVAVVGRAVAHLTATVRAIEAAGGQALAVPADVRDQEALERGVDKTEQELGPITLLVNNAAIVRPLGPLWETNAEEWWHTVDVNLRGTMLGMRAVLPRMLPRRYGRIMNLASGAATQAIAYGSAYVVSKTALARLTENVALEVQGCGVHVFAIDPGNVRTDMTKYLMDSSAGQQWLPWFRRIFEEGQDDPPERVAHLVCRIGGGELDALSGCFVSVADDVNAMVARVVSEPNSDLYTLRMHT
jgi:NAD(P)-dependent dehydrogenase (short-subunit alcohol dehydrogenase family)